jgi:hypothetical protein
VNLLSNWQEILKRAWSIRLILLAGLLTGIEAILPFFGKGVPGLKVVTLVVVMAAFVARLTAQKDLK